MLIRTFDATTIVGQALAISKSDLKKSRFLLATISWYIINIKNFKGRVLYLVLVKDYVSCSFCFEICEFGETLKKEHVFFHFRLKPCRYHHLSTSIYLTVNQAKDFIRLQSVQTKISP